MGSEIKISSLSDVKPVKSHWRVEVKVLHKWISTYHQSGTSMEMVLADRNGVKIHASCKQSLMPKLESHFRVGEWKVITNFTLSPASGCVRTTKHDFKIGFVDETTISDSNIQCHNMFLELGDFANMLNGEHDPRFLIDVIGQVLDLGVIDIVQTERKEVSKVEFSLRDIKNQRVHCCITGRLAQMLTQEDNKPNNGDICLIRFAKLGSYNGEMQVSNAFDSTLVVMNPDISEAKALSQMFDGDRYAVGMSEPQKVKILIQNKRLKWSNHPFKTIQEMKHTEKGGKCRVVCTVYAVDTIGGWYYFVCLVCNKEVFKSPIVFDEQNVPNWWCEFCHRNVVKVSPRFKLDLLVQDLTGETNFKLLDTVATWIVKKSAAKVLKNLSDEVGNQEILPTEIIDIVGKTYGFGISIDESNTSSGIQFNALKVWSLDDILWKRIKSLHQISTSSRKKMCTNGNSVENNNHDEAQKNKSG